MFQLNGMANTSIENMEKKYGKRVAYLFNPEAVGFKVVESLAAELREDPEIVEKIIEREVSMHFLRQSEKKNDPNLVMVTVGNIWNSLYNSTLGENEIVCDHSANELVVTSINNSKSSFLTIISNQRPICLGLYLANPDESILLCNRYSEEKNEYGFYDVKRLDALYTGPETRGRQPRNLCRYAFEHIDRDSARVLSISEIANILSKRLYMHIPDYEAKAQVVRNKLL